ncbi:YoaK family protein [Kitasatospora sp. NBC_01266]|uniref:YoaK family protein n=1 Tax=Kitasatospora sp. NBC_01266 TaxID=2903572 RepID=UPI002E310D50|nr:YoaK family protein [Kitasatospora sp. NBC_01266]
MPAVLREAWTTVVPDLTDRHGPLPPLMIVLTVVTGLIDAFSYLTLGHVFVANMTGNVVFSGFAIVGAAGFSLAASLASLAAFAAGALLGGRLGRSARQHRARVLHRALTVEAALVAGAFLATQVVGHPYGGQGRYPLIALLGLAMGVQNAAARALAVPDLTTTVLTLTITGIAADSRLAGGPDARAGRRLLSAAAMLVGALAGACAVLHGHPALVLLLAAALLAAAGLAALRFTGTSAAWSVPM